MEMTKTERIKYKKARELGVYFLKERQPDQIERSRLTLAFGHPDFWFGKAEVNEKKIGCFTDTGRCLVYDGKIITEVL